MTSEMISTDQIRVQDSLFYFKQSLSWANEDPAFRVLGESIWSLGQLSPIILYQDQNELYHLVDGFKRVCYAEKDGWGEILSVVIPFSEELGEIVDLVFYEQCDFILKTAMTKAQFIVFCRTLGMSTDTIQNRYHTLLGLDFYQALFLHCEKMVFLPMEVQDFCAEKGFSFKQCLNLTTQPKHLLQEVFSWRETLPLSASVIDEFLDHLRPILDGSGQTISQFMEDVEIKNIFQSSLNGQVKVQRLRTLLRERRNPVLTKVNRQLNTIKKDLNLPKGLELHWDPSLENKRVKLELTLETSKDLEALTPNLDSSSFKQGVSEILNEL